jgi:CRP-like cAMP-binding protein
MQPAMSTSGWKVDREFLARTPIFGGLPGEVLDRLNAAAAIVDMPAGAQLVGEGELAKHLFIVCEGGLEILKRGSHGSPVRLAVLAGDCVGEMPLIDIQPRSATVRAVGPSVVFRVDHGEIARLRQASTEVYTLLVLKHRARDQRRLRRADQVLPNRGIMMQDLWSSAGTDPRPDDADGSSSSH